MNVLIIAGRGNTGCGDVRMAIEIEDYFKENGDFVKVIEGFDKPWTRPHAQGELDWIKHKFLTNPFVDTINYDMCLITSVTPINVNKDRDKANLIFENFLNTIRSLRDKGTRIVYLQCDNKINSINRNFYALEEFKDSFFELLDRVIVHNVNADFVKKFIDKKVSPNHKFTIGQQVLISTDFDEVKSIIKDSPKIDKTCWFIGRSAQWKGWREFRDLHTNVLKDAGWLSVIEGIELSINAKQDLCNVDENNHYTWRDDALYYQKGRFNTPVEEVLDNADTYRHMPILIYGPYNRVEALNRVHRSKFGMFFTYTGPEFGGQIEITFLEIVGAGTVPVIRKELWEHAYFNDTYLKDLGSPEDLGIVVWDEIDTLNKLNEDEDLYNEYLRRALTFCKSQFDRKYIIKRLIDKCNSNKDEVKRKMQEISLF